MRIEKETIKRLLLRQLTDNLARTWFSFRSCSYQEMLTPYGGSGSSRFELLVDEIKNEAKIRAALAWLEEAEVPDIPI